MATLEPAEELNALQWGIMATGGIAKAFVKDLLLAPVDRQVDDVSHSIAAIASSSSLEKAEEFIAQNFPADSSNRSSVKAYGNYEELVADQRVEIVYVATPQSRHYTDVLMALNAGKHVCCEKPMTINAAQTEHLIDVARSKSLFLMEALWTRFFPHIKELKKILHDEDTMGEIRTVRADFSLDFTPNGGLTKEGYHHRIYQPKLGGGALLDLGIYPLTWAFLSLYDNPRNGGEMPKVNATMLMTDGKGEDGWDGPVDEHTTVVLSFEKLHATAVLTCGLSTKTPHGQCVLIQGTKGDARIPWASYRPDSFTVDFKPSDSTKNKEPIECKVETSGTWLFWEADACFRAIRGGKLETEECPLSESLAVMKIMDEARRQCGFRYPEEIESVEKH